ncbi:hypothetical protein ACFL1I_07585 [Candidatus Omnitrophota bacterium]
MKTSLLKSPYRFGIYLPLVFISIYVLVKMSVWHGASADPIKPDQYFPIKQGDFFKFTSKIGQQMHNTVDYLLAPAIILPFALLTVKLIKSRDPFEEVA